VETWQAYNHLGRLRTCTNGPGGGGRTTTKTGRSRVSLDRPYDAKRRPTCFLYHEREARSKLAERFRAGRWPTVTSMDNRRPIRNLLDGAHALFTRAHDEYWTPQERNARHGGPERRHEHSPFIGAKHHVPADPDGQQHPARGAAAWSSCYKKRAICRDPMYGKNNALVTSELAGGRRSPDPEGRPLTGTLYESKPGDPPTSSSRVAGQLDPW